LDDTICFSESPYLCECLINNVWVYAAMVDGTVGQAEASCFTACTDLNPLWNDYKLTPVACVGDVVSPDCSAWVPAAAVGDDPTSDAYQVDYAFVSALIADPEPLWACDNATVSLASGGGGYEVANADRGELLHELGLRNGDVVTSLNGHKFSSATAVAIAFSDLWSGGEISFELQLRRNDTTLELHYLLANP